MGLFHQNKFFPANFRCQSVFSLATCVFLFNQCLCPCPSLHHSLNSTSFMLLFWNASSFTTSLPQFFPCSTVTFFVWKSTFVYKSLLYTSINNIIAEWFITITTNVATRSTVVPIIIEHVSTLMQFMLKQKNSIWIKYNWKIFFYSGT